MTNTFSAPYAASWRSTAAAFAEFFRWASCGGVEALLKERHGGDGTFRLATTRSTWHVDGRDHRGRAGHRHDRRRGHRPLPKARAGGVAKDWFRKGVVRARYDEQTLITHLKRVFGKDLTLGDDSLGTGADRDQAPGPAACGRLGTTARPVLQGQGFGRGLRTATTRCGRWSVRLQRLHRFLDPEPDPDFSASREEEERSVCRSRRRSAYNNICVYRA